MSRIPAFTYSKDGVPRSDWRMTFRLSRHDLTSVLANHVDRMGAQLSSGEYETSIDGQTEDMRIPDVARAIRDQLHEFGVSSIMFDGSDDVRAWAERQVNRAL